MSASWSPGPILVAGPCLVEDDATNLAIGETLAELSARLGLRTVYKASFDKANRARAEAFRGPGLDRGLEALKRVREHTGLPVITDIHDVSQVAPAAEVVDALQVPAFLCRQTDLLAAVGRAGLPVNLKKGQWMSPEAMSGAVEKVRQAGGGEVAVTERGTFFGYGDLVVDMRVFGRLKSSTGCPALYDATHSLQRPGQGAGGASGAHRDALAPLLFAAAGAGADGFFVETHPDPDSAPSDGASMCRLAELEALIATACDVWSRATARGAVHA